MNRPQLLDQAMNLQNRLEFAEAEKIYRRLLTADPRDVDALQLLGYLRLQSGKPGDARPLYERALAIDPQPAFQLYLGECRLLEGAPEDALPLLTEAARALPTAAEPHLYLGFALLRLHRRAEAFAALRTAIACDPHDHANVASLSRIFAISGQHEDAVGVFSELLQVFPGSAALHYGLGAALVCLGREEEAEPHLRAAIDSGDAQAEAFDFMGRCAKKAGRVNEALGFFQRAVQLKPDFLSAMNNLAVLLADYDHLNEAVAVHCTALRRDPQYLPATSNMASCLIRQGNIAAAIDFSRRATRLAPETAALGSNLLLNLNYSPDLTPEQLFAEHVQYQQDLDTHSKLPVAPFITTVSPAGHRRRLAFVSGDLRKHSVAYWIEPLLTHLDSTRWETVVFDTHGESDSMTERLRRHVAEWHNIASKTHAEALQLIREAGVHVLVDLSGHTARNLLPVFDRRAAPVQLSFLGYPNTTGLRNMDGRLTDALADPPGATERYHSERLYRFAHSAWCYQPPPHSPEPARKPSDHIVFGCFNNLAKIQPPMVEHWAKLMERVPGSRFYLKSGGLQDPYLNKSFIAQFAAFGISGERVRIEGRKAGVDSHLACYHEVDIALDTFPYHGTTTTAEALWMGVPVVSLAGPDHRSRVGASLLTNVGHPEWVAHSWDQYVAAAAGLAADRPRLATIRNSLRGEMSASPLMQAAAYAADFMRLAETALTDRLVPPSSHTPR